jgi:hypothetical protein
VRAHLQTGRRATERATPIQIAGEPMLQIQEIVSSAIFKYRSLLNSFVFIVSLFFEGGQVRQKSAGERFHWSYDDAQWAQ